MREIIAADQPFVRSEVSADEALDAVRRPAVQGRDHRARQGGRRRRRRARQRRGRRRRDDQRVPQHARVRRPVQGPARAVDRAPRPLQAAEGRRRLLAGQREGPDAAAHLRHGVGVRRRARRPTSSMLVEAEKRDHRRLATELDLLSFPSELGGGLAVWHPKGAIVRKLMEDYSRAAPPGRRLRVRVHAAPHQGRSCSRRAATSPGTPTACTRRWRWTTARTT